jgi:hypothetical protein
MKQINIFNRKVFIKDLIITAIIVALPFLFYLYLLVPEGKVWETPFFTIESNYYNDVNILVWTAFTKLLTLFFLSLWFVTCKHWWKYSLIISIIIEGYKLLTIVNDEIRFFDEYEFITSLPFTIPLVLFLIFISRKINKYSLIQNLNTEIDGEISEAINKMSEVKNQKYKSIKNQLKDLKKNKKQTPSHKYLEELIQMKKNLMGLD